jgi:hypothetical protein
VDVYGIEFSAFAGTAFDERTIGRVAERGAVEKQDARATLLLCRRQPFLAQTVEIGRDGPVHESCPLARTPASSGQGARQKMGESLEF